VPALSHKDKLKLLSALESGYANTEELLEGVTDEELLYIPPVRDAWSINDFLVHFLDADIALAFRARMAIAESGKAVSTWDENVWHDTLRYCDEKGLVCLTLAKRIRAFLAVSVEAVMEADWSKFYIEHPTKGSLDLGDIIAMHDQHVAFHLPLIRRNRKAWLDNRPDL
jgi:hypothetical protein